MDSLLATYASSDEEELEEQRSPPSKSESKAGVEKEDTISSSKHGGIFDSLPPPKSSLFNSLPQPKSHPYANLKPQAEIEPQGGVDEPDGQISRDSNPKSSSSSLFSSLPPPKDSKPKSSSSLLFSSLPPPKSSSSSSSSKRVVQFRPPTITNPRSVSLDDEDDEDDEGEEEEERKKKRSKETISTSSAASFLSSIPAPRHSATLGALPSASGRSRRSVIETEAASSDVSPVNPTGSDAFVDPNVVYSNNQSSDVNYAYSSWVSGGENPAYYNGSTPNDDGVVDPDPSHYGDHYGSLDHEENAYYGAYSSDVNSVRTAGCDPTMDSNIGSYEAVDYSYAPGQHIEYTDYGSNAQYEDNMANAMAFPEVSGVVENALPVHGKKGRKDIPPDIVEVKQDDLMKNRPREDQVRLTGIAFGPAYQPASTKGKPTKLHKRKHQIGSLYFEMKQKESELAERRSRGFLTKAQTQGKYGW